MQVKSLTDEFEIVETEIFNIESSHDHETVVIITRRLAQKAGFKITDEVMIATAASELATNIIRYAVKGIIGVSIIKLNACLGIQIHAKDNGPGIADIQLAMQDCYTTTERSLGMGLSSVKRIMDEFEIDSKLYVGTVVITRKWC